MERTHHLINTIKVRNHFKKVIEVSGEISKWRKDGIQMDFLENGNEKQLNLGILEWESFIVEWE